MKTKFILFTCLLFNRCLEFTDVFAQSSISATITVTPYTQEQSQWCWAACTRMVDWAYSSTTPPVQCSIVNKANDQCDGWFNICCSSLNGSRPSACSTPLSSNYPNNMYGCNGSLSWLMNYYAGPNTSYGSSLSSSLVTGNIAAGKLMVARWGWTSGGGHFVVLYGFKQVNGSPLTVSYANPSSGSRVTENYSYFVANSNRTWTHTLRMNQASVQRNAGPVTQVTDFGTSLRIYPNPSVGVITIERMDRIEAVVAIKILQATGEVVYSGELQPGQMAETLNLKDKLAAGIYFLRATVDGEISTEKIIIQ